MEDRNDGGEARQKLLFVYYQGGIDALAGEHRRIVDLNKKESMVAVDKLQKLLVRHIIATTKQTC